VSVTEWFAWLCGALALSGLIGMALIGLYARKPYRDDDSEWWV